jgi:hyperosmotically inducible protein
MKHSMKITLGLAVLLLAAPMLAATSGSGAPPVLAKQVERKLVMLPYYGVFDNLEYKVEGNTVTLSGQVLYPWLRGDAVAAVRSIPGIGPVVDKIKVLPTSFMDNQIRWAELRAIYRQPALNRYALGPNPSIHIIVKNGHVTLDGVVQTQFDKNIANIAANGVPNVFSVTNNLRVVG